MHQKSISPFFREIHETPTIIRHRLFQWILFLRWELSIKNEEPKFQFRTPYFEFRKRSLGTNPHTSVTPVLVGISSSTLLKLWLLFFNLSNDNFFFKPEENDGEDGDLLIGLLLSFGEELGVLLDDPPSKNISKNTLKVNHQKV